MVDNNWLTRIDRLWMVIGGFYLIGYLYRYISALKILSESVGDSPAPYPRHWPLDFVATGMAGGVPLFPGFRRTTELTRAAAVETAETVEPGAPG